MSAVGLAKARAAVESKKHKKAGGELLASLQDITASLLLHIEVDPVKPGRRVAGVDRV